MGEVQFGLVVAGAFDDGVDEVGLAALRDLLADEVPDVGGALVGGAAGDDGRAAGRHLVDDADVEIAVEGEGERARDGRRGHGEDVGVGDDAVGAGLAHQLEALLDAEAVLLVDDDQAEVGEVGLVLLQGMGADDELGFAAHDAALGLALGGGIERAGEQGDLVGLAGGGRDGAAEELARGEVVLRGEDFGGRHQRGLGAVFDGDQRGLHGDDGFAGADVALQQAAHGLGLAHVGDDFAEDAFLRGGGMEGKDLLDGLADGGAGGEGGADALAHAAAFEFEAEFEVEELLEDEAAVRGGGGGHQFQHGRAGFGEVDGAEGGEAGGEVEAAKHCGWEGLRDGAEFVDPTRDGGAVTNGAPGFGGWVEVFEDGPDDAAESIWSRVWRPRRWCRRATRRRGRCGPFRAWRIRRRDRCAGFGQDFELRLDHFEAAGGGAESARGCGGHGGAGGFELAVDGDHLAELELVLEIRAVEPHALDGAEALAEGHLEDGAGAGAEEDGAADLADDGGHGAGGERGDGLRVEAVFVAEGQVVEQVFDGFDAAGGEGGGDALADAFYVFDRGGEFEHQR